MAKSVRDGKSLFAFTTDQRDDLELALGDEYKRLLPILERVAEGHRANQSLPSFDDSVRTMVQAGKKLAAPCRRFLRDIEKVTPRWREVQQQSYGPPSTPAELDERMSALNNSRSAVESLLEQANKWEEIGRGRPRRKPGKQTVNRLSLAKWIGLQMIGAGIRLTKHAHLKTLPDGSTTTRGGKFATVLQVVYTAAGEPVKDLYQDVDKVVDTLQEFQ